MCADLTYDHSPLLFNDKVINSKKKNSLYTHAYVRSILKHYIKGKIN